MTTALPVAFYLKELSGEPARRGARPPAGADGTSDLEVQINEAHARGILEARAAAQVELDAALAKQAASFDAKLVAERKKWAAVQSVALADQIAARMLDIETQVSDCVSRLLEPLLAEQIRSKAVQELEAALRGMLTKGEYAKITISGPEDLVSTMETRLGESHHGLSFVASDSIDLSVIADDTILETRISAWIDAIKEDGA